MAGGQGDDVFSLGFASSGNALDGGRGLDAASFTGGAFPSIDNSCWRIETITLDAQGPGCTP